MGGYAGPFLEAVDILRVDSKEAVLGFEEGEEAVGLAGCVGDWGVEDLGGEFVEWSLQQLFLPA